MKNRTPRRRTMRKKEVLGPKVIQDAGGYYSNNTNTGHWRRVCDECTEGPPGIKPGKYHNCVYSKQDTTEKICSRETSHKKKELHMALDNQKLIRDYESSNVSNETGSSGALGEHCSNSSSCTSTCAVPSMSNANSERSSTIRAEVCG